MPRGKEKGVEYKSPVKKRKRYKGSIEGNLELKPLSVNSVWQGRRFKTKAYKDFEIKCFALLDKEAHVETSGLLEVYYEFGFSSMRSDVDNGIKPLQDILCKMYSFEDNRIMKLTAIKRVVKKGEEYIKYKISKFKETNDA